MSRRSELGVGFSLPPAGPVSAVPTIRSIRAVINNLSGLIREELDTGYLVYVFPAFTMAMRAGANNWLSFRPDGRERTRVLGGHLLRKELVSSDPEVASARAALIERVDEEDALATTEVARTMRSRKAPAGTVLAVREDPRPVPRIPRPHTGPSSRIDAGARQPRVIHPPVAIVTTSPVRNDACASPGAASTGAGRP